MKTYTEGQINTVALGMLIIGFIIGCVIMITIYQDDYRNGQIDALSGKIKYEQITKKVWVEKP